MAREKKTSTANNGRLTAPLGGVAVRMYRQGLGDCFLLAFGPEKAGDNTRYVLIDCGVHARQDNGPKRLAQVLDDVWQATGGHLHVVVATHEHADHLSGFVQKGSPFLRKDGFTIDQLWIAWTERYGDALADRLRRRRATARRIVERAVKTVTEKLKMTSGSILEGSAETTLLAPSSAGFQTSSESESAPPRPQVSALNALADRLEANFDFELSPEGTDDEAARAVINAADNDRKDARGLHLLMHSGDVPPADGEELGAKEKEREKPTSNELALGVLQARAEEVKYCLPGDRLKVDGLSGVDVHVLGPPHDEAKLKKDLPTKVRGAEEGADQYKETYISTATQSLSFGLSPALGMDLTDEVKYPPDFRYPFDFDQRKQVDFAFPEDEQFEQFSEGTRQLLDSTYFDSDASWQRIDADWLDSAADLALNLDSDTNNTSLVLAFEWNKRVLLFVGDAQVGNWLSWGDQKYKDKRGREKVTVEDLLQRTVLYKVGHHGSHNATLKRNPATATDAQPLGGPYGLELMRDIVAMIPVDRAAAEKKMPNSWEMPHQPLYERLREKARRRVLRSDANANVRPLAKDAPADIVPRSTDGEDVPDMPFAKWKRSEETFGSSGDPLYYEIRLEMEPTQSSKRHEDR